MSLTPRYEGIGAHETTFLIDASTITYDAAQKNGSAQVGLMVKLIGDGVVSLTDDGDTAFQGRLEIVHPDGACSVNDDGYMEVQYTGTVTIPTGLVGSATRGKVKAGTNPIARAVSKQNLASGYVVLQLA